MKVHESKFQNAKIEKKRLFWGGDDGEIAPP